MTGGSALAADQQIASDRSVRMIEIATFVVIITMLMLVYRSIRTVLLVLVMVVLTLSASRGVVAFLGYHELIGLSTFATNLLVTLAIAAATDYAIFLIGRYQEARTNGEDRESAYYTMFHGTAHVVLGSGMTIAGATFCLSFTRLPYFQSLGVPLAVGMSTGVLVALTLGPAIITVASRFGLLEPKRAMRIRGWRKVGAAIVRWPGPVLVATIALSLVGLVTLPGYQPSYNDRKYVPQDLPANQGFAAAERHFSVATMNPELLLIESDHDLRNSADFLVIDKIAKAIFRVPGISRVQAITRPDGKPVKFSTIPAQMSLGGVGQDLNRKYQQDRMADMLKQADEMQVTIDTMTRMSNLMGEMSATTHSMVEKTRATTVDIAQLRDYIANFDDFFRPIRNYFYWEPHCFDIPVCFAMRSVFDTHRRRRHDDQRCSGIASRSRTARFADAATDCVDAAADRDDEDNEEHDADDARLAGRVAGSAGRAGGEPVGHGRRVQRLLERRQLLPTTGDLRQRRVQTRYGQLHLAERSCGPDDHLSTREIRSPPTESIASRRSSTRPRRRSRVRRWRDRRSTSAALPRRSRTCRKATITTS